MLSKHNLLLAAVSLHGVMECTRSRCWGVDSKLAQAAPSCCRVNQNKLCFTKKVESSPKRKADAVGAVAGTHRKEPQQRKATQPLKPEAPAPALPNFTFNEGREKGGR